ncbi:hypothetical protein ACEPAH_7053 [Sanghuangporus vaninii]
MNDLKGLEVIIPVQYVINWFKENDLRERAVGFFGKDDNMSFIVFDGSFVFAYHLFALACNPDAVYQVIDENPTGFAIGHSHKSHPYLFAFVSRDGSVKIWSILTNNSLEGCQSAEDFEVQIFCPSAACGPPGTYLKAWGSEVPEMPSNELEMIM